MRKFATISLAILLTGVFAWAGQSWKDKPYEQWSQKEVDQVMNHSAWSQSIRVSMGFGLGDPGMAGPQGPVSPQGRATQPTMGGPPSVNNPNGGMMAQRTTYFQARWVSSLVMRQALARTSVLAGQLTEADAQRYLSETPTDYQIAVFGPIMKPFEGLSTAELQKRTYLQLKSEKKKIPAAGVKIDKTGTGAYEAVTFSFPKTLNGQPTIGPKEKEIDLYCKLKHNTLKFRFEPRKMVTKNGRDL